MARHTHARTTLLAGLLAAALGLLATCSKPTSPGFTVEDLPEIQGLPDPLRMTDGKRVSTRADWRRRREEIRAVLERYEYGRMPPGGSVQGARELSREQVDGASRRLVRLALSRGIQMHLGLVVPEGQGPFPAIVHIDHRGLFRVPTAEGIARRGYLLVGLDPNFLDPDEAGVLGSAQAAYPDHDWGTLAVWAWGAMRALDYLGSLELVDKTRILVTGHSRSGKAALWAGALDERFALVAPQGSGCAGAAAYRARSDGAETLGHITRAFPHWFGPALRQFVGRENRLPFDQHFALALVAPRALLSIDALGDLWANPQGTRQAHEAAREVFAFLGAKDRLALSLRQGEHALTDEDWNTLLDFADRVLGRPVRRR